MEAEVVAERLGSYPDGRVNVIGSEPLDAERMDDAQRHLFEVRASVAVLHEVLQDVALVDDRGHFGNAAHAWVAAQHIPVLVVGDETWPVDGHFLVKQLTHGAGEGPEHLALFHQVDALKGLQVGRMDREKVGKLLEPLGEAGIESSEGA